MAGDKKILKSKLDIMKKLGPPSPGEFTHDAEGEELEDDTELGDKPKPKTKKKPSKAAKA